MPTDTALVQHNGTVPVTKLRNIRVDDALWRLASVVARRRQETVSGVLKRLLYAYVEEHATDEDRAKAAEQ